MDPLFGVETEYGCAWASPQGGEAANYEAALAVVGAVSKILPCLRDTIDAGVFLPNGSRIYVDGSHVEAATCEVSNPWDLVRYLVACHRVLERAIERVREESGRDVLLFRTNVDHEARESWGCHESFLCSPSTPDMTAQLAPHLVSRIVYAGAGGFNPMAPGLEFVLSPRALFISLPESPCSTAERGLVQLKGEPCAVGAYRRLHLLCGESLCSTRANWLRAAATAIVVAMIDAGLTPADGVRLANPIDALYRLTEDPTGRTRLRLAGGGSMTAVDVQRHYLRLAEAHREASFMPSWTAVACGEWRRMLDEIEHGAPALSVSLDWAIKRSVFQRVLTRHELGWDDLPRMTKTRESGVHRHPAISRRQVRTEILACDIRFGQLGTGGLFADLDRQGVLSHDVPGVEALDEAVDQPPATGRARVRGLAVRRLAEECGRTFACDWASIFAEGADELIDLGDPFETEERWRRKTTSESVAHFDRHLRELRHFRSSFDPSLEFAAAARRRARTAALAAHVPPVHTQVAPVRCQAIERAAVRRRAPSSSPLLGAASGLLMWLSVGAVSVLADWVLGGGRSRFDLLSALAVAGTAGLAAARVYHGRPGCLALGRAAFALSALFNALVVDYRVSWAAAAAAALALSSLAGCGFLFTNAAVRAIQRDRV
jgi:proteasome accessory factor A